MNFIEKNIMGLPEEHKKEFLIRFKIDIEKHRAYAEKTGIGTYILLHNLPEAVLYKMQIFVQSRLPKI